MTLKIFEETCVHRNTVPIVCARTWAIIRLGFSLENDMRKANGIAGDSLGFKYSYRVKEFRVSKDWRALGGCAPPFFSGDMGGALPPRGALAAFSD